MRGHELPNSLLAAQNKSEKDNFTSKVSLRGCPSKTESLLR